MLTNNLLLAMTQQPQHQVSIYLRNNRKQARIVQVPPVILPYKLLSLAAVRFNLPQERVVLFYGGFRIDTLQTAITLTQKSILHVIDRRGLELQEINLNFKPLGFTGQPSKITVLPSTTIKQVIQTHISNIYPSLQQNYLYLVHLGKTLNPINTISQQFIESQCQILVIEHKPKEAVEYHQSRHVMRQTQSADQTRMPVTFTSKNTNNLKAKMMAAAQKQKEAKEGVVLSAAPSSQPSGDAAPGSAISRQSGAKGSTISRQSEKAAPGEADEKITPE